MTTLIFYYYWTFDLRPAPAKAEMISGHIVGAGDIKLTPYKWTITADEYKLTLRELTLKYPWPEQGPEQLEG